MASKKQKQPTQQDKKRSVKRIENSVLDYYRHINEQLDQGFQDDAASQELFLGNVFDQLSRETILVFCHQRTSYIIEKLVPMASSDQVLMLLQKLVNDFDRIVVDRSGSYVLQTVLYKVTEFLTSDEENPFTKALHMFGMKFLERAELFTDSYASHILRCLAEVLSGVKVDTKVVKGKFSSQSKSAEAEAGSGKQLTPHGMFHEFEELLEALANMALPTAPNLLLDLLKDSHSAAVAQTFLLVFQEKKPGLCKQCCERVLNSDCLSKLDSSGIPIGFSDQSSSYFFSALIKVMSKKQLSSLIDDVIIANFKNLVNHASANYNVQDVIENLHTSKQFGKILRAIREEMPEVLYHRAGILLKVIQTSLRFTDKQDDVIEMLRTTLDCDSSQLFLSLIKGNDKVADSLKKVTYLQSMIVQRLLQFSNSEPISSGIETLTTTQAVALATSNYGAFIYNAYLDSETIPLSNKKSLSESLQPAYPAIITDKFGSRVFEAFWAMMSVPCKKNVIEELGKQEGRLFGNHFSRIVAYKIHLSDFVHHRPQWDKWLIEENRKRKLSSKDRKSNDKKMKLDKNNIEDS